jgi:DNA-binding XRE family transcriptional regulator
MPNDRYSTVRLDTSHALRKAKLLPGFVEQWNATEEEYIALAALLGARKQAGLTQEQLAGRMGTTKSAVSRLESSLRAEKRSPSFATLKKYAQACGKRIVIQLV